MHGGSPSGTPASVIFVNCRGKLRRLFGVEIAHQQIANTRALHCCDRIPLLAPNTDFSGPHRSRRKIRRAHLNLLRVVHKNADTTSCVPRTHDVLKHGGPLGPERHKASADQMRPRSFEARGVDWNSNVTLETTDRLRANGFGRKRLRVLCNELCQEVIAKACVRLA